MRAASVKLAFVIVRASEMCSTSAAGGQMTALYSTAAPASALTRAHAGNHSGSEQDRMKSTFFTRTAAQLSKNYLSSVSCFKNPNRVKNNVNDSLNVQLFLQTSAH